MKKKRQKYYSIRKRFWNSYVSFALGLILTFIVGQGLLQFFAFYADKTLNTQEDFSTYWKQLNELDGVLYVLEQTPTEEFWKNGETISEHLVLQAESIDREIKKPRSRDLYVLTWNLCEEIRKGKENTNKELTAECIYKAQDKINILMELYNGFSDEMEKYIKKHKEKQFTVRLNASLGIFLVDLILAGLFILQGKNLILKKKPDLVITDIMMPGMDGLKIITKIQATGLNIRFLIISAYANFSYAREAMRLGVKDFLEKPIDEDELNKALYRIAYEEEKIENKEIEKINDNKKNEEKEVSGIIQSAKKYIDEHFSEKLTLEEVAEYVYLSPNYLSSLFRREMNMNFVEYITDVRMRQAEKFLADARLSISDIARMTGYRDAGYFCNVFIRKYGMSPSLWRKRNKGI